MFNPNDFDFCSEPWISCYCLTPGADQPIYCERFSEQCSSWVVHTESPSYMLAEDGSWQPGGAFLARNGDRRARPMRFDSARSALTYLKSRSPAACPPTIHN